MDTIHLQNVGLILKKPKKAFKKNLQKFFIIKSKIKKSYGYMQLVLGETYFGLNVAKFILKQNKKSVFFIYHNNIII
ncbi:MAG: hypothetical protein CM15mP111_3710 [Hyphomicrobiales bacterium]|nr:MAG: hypothetical protein CM15mP111_3710 [Hyphomicrobiales bacterium]